MVEMDTTSPPLELPIRVPKGLSLEQTHELKRDKAILEMQENQELDCLNPTADDLT